MSETPSWPAGMKRWCGIHVGRTRRHQRRFRAPARADRRSAQFSRWGAPLRPASGRLGFRRGIFTATGRCRAPSARVAIRGLRWLPSGAVSEPPAERRAGKGTPRRSPWGPAQPAGGGRQGRTRCPAGKGGRREGRKDPARVGFALALVGRAMPVGDRRSAVACRLREWLCAGFPCLRPAVPVSAPRHHAERRAGKGTPTSGRHSPPQAGGREGPRVGGWFASAGPGVIGAGFALPRVPGPTGRTAQRSAFPCLRPALPVWRPPPGALAAFLCYRRLVEAVRCRARKKNWQRTSFAAGDFGGKCERGLPPFTINNDKSELAAARRRRARKFRFPARSAGRFLDGAPSQSSLSEPF